MEKIRTIEQTYLECDGCQYLIGGTSPPVVVTVPFDYEWMELREGRTLEFHFHTLHNRHDCFRYWAHNPRVMIRSLEERGLNEQEIDEFMGLMLYREDKFRPGIDRPEEKPEPAARYT